jgi:hypothetical protein
MFLLRKTSRCGRQLRTEPGSFERTTALANLENVSRAMV